MSNAVNTLNSLVEYGKHLEYRESLHLPNAVLCSTQKDGKELLQVKLVSQLGVFSRIKRFFHIGNFRTATIQRIAMNAFKEIDPTTTHFLRQPPQKLYLERGVTILNDEITRHNNDVQKIWRWVRRVFHKVILEKVLIPVALQLSSSELSELPTQTDAINPSLLAGLVNTGNHCYCNALVQALRASTGFRGALDSLSEKTEVNNTLRALFSEMEGKARTAPDNGENGVIDCDPGSVYAQFKEAMGKFYKPLQGHRQEDAGELLRVLVDAALSRDTVLKEGKIDTQSAFIPLQPYTYRTKEEDSCVREKYSKTLIPPEALYLPHLDCKHAIEPDQLLTMHIPEGVSLFDIRDFFWGKEFNEQADASAIVDKENKNNPWLTREQRDAIAKIDSEKDKLGRRRKVFPTIPVVTGTRLAVDSAKGAPSWLPGYVPRFTEGRTEKNTTPVLAPYELTLPAEKNGIINYVLKAVVMHEGNAIDGGHYTAVIPKAASKQKGQDMPATWTYISDTSVIDRPYSAMASNIAYDGCIFIYDVVR